MSYGVTTTGFVKKDLATIISETQDEAKVIFGNDLNIAEDSFFTKYNGVLAERESVLWDLAEAIYNAFYPDSSSSAQLDGVVGLTGISRLPATRSTVPVKIYGTKLTAIPTSFIAFVLGNSVATFEPITPQVIGDGTNEEQKIAFSLVPDSGNFTLIFGGQETALIPFSASAATIETELEALSTITSVVVSGDFTTGFIVEFTGVDGEKPQTPITEGGTNTLLNGATPVTLAITEEIVGDLPNVEFTMQAITTGETIALTGTLTEIQTPILGVDSITNTADADVGEAVETDSDLRVRRKNTLQSAGSATVEAVRSKLLADGGVTGITKAIVIENDTDVVVLGRLPHSLECIVEGGIVAEIALIIWEAKAGGIALNGSISEPIIDSQGLTHTIKFSRPTEIDIWMIINIVGNVDIAEGPLYPGNGDALVEAAVLAYTDDFTIGQDVVTNLFFTPINEIAGVIGIEILVGLSSPPTLSANLAIDAVELAKFDSSRIVVNS